MDLLVVEDEPKTAAALREGLEFEGYRVKLAATGDEAYRLGSATAFDLIVLDVMLPGRSGLDVLESLRQGGIRSPVLLLTARDAVEDRVAGLDRGADDYLTKPFAFSELLARIRALLRRGWEGPVLTLTHSDLHMDLVTRQTKRAGKSIDLTTKEFEVLEFLLRHPGQVVSRGMLAAVWDDPARVTSLDNVIDVHIVRLRKKIDQGHTVRLIHTVRGAGFVLSCDDPHVNLKEIHR